MDRAVEERADLAALAREPTEEEAREAVEAATSVVGEFMDAWASEEWDRAHAACQPRWLWHWEEKVKSEEPEPLDRRLIGEGKKPEGPTWKEATGGTVAGMLEQLIGSDELVMWEVDEDRTAARSPVMVDVSVVAVVKDRLGSRSRVRIRARVIRETDPEDDSEPMPSEDPEARWGVNPISVKTQRQG